MPSTLLVRLLRLCGKTFLLLSNLLYLIECVSLYKNLALVPLRVPPGSSLLGGTIGMPKWLSL